MTSPLRRKRRITARGRSTPIRRLASAVGVGLFLIGGAASAQQWVPSTSPYGTWRQPAQATKPAPNSWREDSKPAYAVMEGAAPLPPPPPLVQQPAPRSVESSPASLDQSTPLPLPKVTKDSEPLPPLPPPPVPIGTRTTLIPVSHGSEH